MVETEIVAVVAVVDHKYPVPPDAKRFTDLPWQKVVGPPGVMTAVGNGLTVTTWMAVLVHPLVLVTVTEYMPLADTRIVAVIAVVDHT